jgi:alanine dehydrogenase
LACLPARARRTSSGCRSIRSTDADLRARIFLESGYGDHFGFSDAHLAGQVAGIRPREEIIATCDVVLLPKPTLDDVASLRDGQVLWGWPHAVQDPHMTQICIDKRLTVMAWEAMNHWTTSSTCSS